MPEGEEENRRCWSWRHEGKKNFLRCQRIRAPVVKTQPFTDPTIPSLHVHACRFARNRFARFAYAQAFPIRAGTYTHANEGVGAMRWWRETTPVDHRRGTTRWIERTGSRFAVYRETLHGIRSRDTLVGEDR